VTGRQRLAEFPDVPTVAQSGFPGFELYTWSGLLAPKGLAPAILAKINRQVGEILGQPDVQERFRGISVEPLATTPADFEKRMAEAVVEYTAAARRANISEK
jgi:tripartite-type tricarboxylate transporter receptor subunit TctC